MPFPTDSHAAAALPGLACGEMSQSSLPTKYDIPTLFGSSCCAWLPVGTLRVQRRRAAHVVALGMHALRNHRYLVRVQVMLLHRVAIQALHLLHDIVLDGAPARAVVRPQRDHVELGLPLVLLVTLVSVACWRSRTGWCRSLATAYVAPLWLLQVPLLL